MSHLYLVRQALALKLVLLPVLLLAPLGAVVDRLACRALQSGLVLGDGADAHVLVSKIFNYSHCLINLKEEHTVNKGRRSLPISFERVQYLALYFNKSQIYALYRAFRIQMHLPVTF